MAATIRPLYRHLWPDAEAWTQLQRMKEFDRPHLQLVWTNDELIAFGLYFIQAFDRRTVVYRAGSIVHRDYRNAGLYVRMVHRMIDRNPGMDAYMTRTREMFVYRAFRTAALLAGDLELLPPEPHLNALAPLNAEWRTVATHFCDGASVHADGRITHVYSKPRETELGRRLGLSNTGAIMLRLLPTPRS